MEKKPTTAALQKPRKTAANVLYPKVMKSRQVGRKKRSETS
jgi:hypothetical protein